MAIGSAKPRLAEAAAAMRYPPRPVEEQEEDAPGEGDSAGANEHARISGRTLPSGQAEPKARMLGDGEERNTVDH